MSIVEHAVYSWVEKRPGTILQLVTDCVTPESGQNQVSGLGLIHQLCQPGVGAPSHTHAFEEVLTIIEGTAEVWLGSERRIVGPGTSIFVPVGTLHGFRNVGDGLLRVHGVIAATQLIAEFVEP